MNPTRRVRVALLVAVLGAGVSLVIVAGRLIVAPGRAPAARAPAEATHAAPAPGKTCGANCIVALEGPPPAIPPFVPRGYVPASAVKAPPTRLMMSPPPRPKRLLESMAPPPPHNPGGVDGDRPRRPIPSLR
jgi:hypothetical protein